MVKEIERGEIENVNPFSVQPALQRYVFASQFIEKKIVLDIACGIGYGSDLMKNSQPSSFIVGCDSYFDGLKYGKSVYNNDLKILRNIKMWMK